MRPIGLSAPVRLGHRPVASRLPISRLTSPARPATPAALGFTRARTVSSSQNAPPHPRSIARLLEWKPVAAQDGPGADGEQQQQRLANVVVDGYVRSVRTMKTASFVALGDGSSLAPLQAVVPADQASGLSVGAAVRLVGDWVPSRGRGQSHELAVSKLDIVGSSDAKTFPLQKKYQSPEYLRTVPHLRVRTPFNSALLRLRSEVIRSLSQFFASQDFVQTHPPVLTSSDCEGAGEVFTVSPAVDGAGSPDASGLCNDRGTGESSKSTKTTTTQSFFRSPKYLSVSAQLHLEALAQAVGNVWTLAPTFRAEKSDTSRHLSEFYMLEAEMAFVDKLDGVMDLVEAMLRAVGRDLYGSRVVDELLLHQAQHEQQQPTGHKQKQTPELERASRDGVSPEMISRRWEGLASTSPWPRITYTDAIKLLQTDGRFAYTPRWGDGLQADHERYVARAVGGGMTPVFVTHYPRGIKPFYMLPSSTDTPSSSAAATTSLPAASGPPQPPVETVDCFDLLVPELCEIAGGSMREHRLEPLLAAMQLHGMAAPRPGSGIEGDTGDNRGGSAANGVVAGPLDWYVDLRRWGSPPHGGFGLGFDRLLCYLSGVQTIRDVVTFPRWFGRCDC